MRLITGKKIGTISRRLSAEGFDAAVFISSGSIDERNIQYLTGLGGVQGGAVLLRRGKVELLVNSLDYDRAQSDAVADEIKKVEGKEFGSLIAQRCKGLKKVGCEKTRMTAHAFESLKKKGVKLQDIGAVMDEERAVKEPAELQALEKCAGIANRGIIFLCGMLSEGIKEASVAADLERRLRELGSERAPFETIVTSAKRSAFIHPSPSATQARIGRGLGLVDFGATLSGYICDVTVPFAAGRLSKREEDIMDAVMDARDEMVSAIRPGAEAGKIQEAFEKSLRSKGLEAKHSAGHGIGLDVHEHPSLSAAKPQATLRAGMALAVEPGAYVPGVGGLRIENDFFVTRNGARQLTKSKLIRL
jgi:Xaa-Pro aminopeptidase